MKADFVNRSLINLLTFRRLGGVCLDGPDPTRW